MFDWTINLGHILTVAAILGGGYSFLFTIRNRLDQLTARVSTAETQLIKLVEVLIAQGKQEVRMDAMDFRLNLQGSRVDRAIERFEGYVDSVKKIGV